jgi:hypothetical protein
MIASSRTCRTCSGRISGTGLASAKMIGRSAIFATISGVIAPATERPTKTSHPCMTSSRVRAPVSACVKRAL